jgi:exosome complex component RRP45
VIAGRAVWAVRCDVTVESDDGNLERLVTTAAVLALLQYRRPEVSVSAASLPGPTDVFE